ncbi:NAD(P)-binding domain-containing protein [Streptomyces rimosus]|uniref:imine reductase family protein n=1 Tax=Streptomyces rimosus TaxID=1927 RepID=UPI0004CA5F2F|nr:NAD(P)-binding domain-containing protein [Streptomyces rimosus]
MTSNALSAEPTPVTVLGLGAMGRALAAAFLAGGHPTTVWNRTPGRADALVAAGATLAATAAEAVVASPVTVVCLMDHRSVSDVLTPLADRLAGRTVINLTTVSPADARATAAWADEHGIAHLSGAIMTVPVLVGGPQSMLLYSGPQALFTAHLGLLERLGSATHLGTDPGTAPLYDVGLLTAMYTMFGGFLHGAALVGTAGVSAKEFTELAVPWLNAMTLGMPAMADFLDSGDYRTDVQSLDFNEAAVAHLVHTSREAGIGADVLLPVLELIRRQISEGHGTESVTRLVEGIKDPRTSVR